MPSYTRGMSTTPTSPANPTNHSTRPPAQASSPNPFEGGPAPALLDGATPARLEEAPPAPHVYAVHTPRPVEPAPMPIYLGAQNTPTTEDEQTPLETEGGRPPQGRSHLPSTRAGSATPAQGPSSAGPYNPAELLKALLALLGLLLGLTLWLGGWQPHTSEARLGWSHGTIQVVEGTDGDTGSQPLPVHDSGAIPAGQAGDPVDLPRTYVGDGSRFAPGISPWAGPVDA